MKKLDIDKYLKLLEVKKFNQTQIFETEQLNFEDQLLVMGEELGAFSSKLSEHGLSAAKVENLLRSIPFEPHKQLFCDRSGATSAAFFALARWINAVESSQLLRLLLHERQLAVIASLIRNMYVSTYLCSRWRYSDADPIWFRSLTESAKLAPDVLLEEGRKIKATDEIFDRLEELYTTESSTLRRVRKIYSKYLADQMYFGLSAQEGSTYWFDGEKWQSKKVKHRLDFALAVFEEQVCACLTYLNPKFKKEQIVQALRHFRKTQNIKSQSFEAFVQRSKRVRRELNLTSFEQYLILHLGPRGQIT